MAGDRDLNAVTVAPDDRMIAALAKHVKSYFARVRVTLRALKLKRYPIFAMIASPNSLHLIFFAPSIWRAKS